MSPSSRRMTQPDVRHTSTFPHTSPDSVQQSLRTLLRGCFSLGTPECRMRVLTADLRISHPASELRGMFRATIVPLFEQRTACCTTPRPCNILIDFDLVLRG